MLKRSPLQAALRHPLRAPILPSLTQQALAILRRYGTDAHVYMPGASGVAVSGLLSNNYTLSDGSTGFSAVDGTAGLVLDALGSVGAELVTNGGFDVDASWTKGAGWTISGGAAVLTAASGILSQSLIITAGSTYQVSVDTDLNYQLRLSGVNLGYHTGNKTLFVVAAASGLLEVVPNGVQTGTMDNISVKQVTGIHATQSTTAAKPAERRGLYNLLKYSQDLSNAIWVKRGTCTVNSTPVAGPTGALNGYAVTGLNTGNNDLYQISAATAASGTLSPAIWIQKVSASGEVSIENAHTSDRGRWTVDLALIGSSWELIGVGHPAVTVANAFTSSTLDGFMVKGVSGGPIALNLCLAGLFQGALTAAQILAEGGIPLTTSAAASNPTAGKYWWDFPTVGKGIALGSPVAQMADDSYCIVCVNATPSGADKYAANLGCGASTQLVSSVAIKAATGYAQAAWVDDAVHVVSVIDTVNNEGRPTVVTALKRGGIGYLRVNGVQVGSGASLATIGATTVTNGMIGGFNTANTSNQFQGAMGEPIMGKGAISDADLLALERQCASTFPNGPTF